MLFTISWSVIVVHGSGVGEPMLVLLEFVSVPPHERPIRAVTIAINHNAAIEADFDLFIIFYLPSFDIGNDRKQTKPRLLTKRDGRAIVKPSEPRVIQARVVIGRDP